MTGMTSDRHGGLGWPIIGSLAALVASPLLELITGNEMLYTVPILAFFLLFCLLTKMSRGEIGLRLGALNPYVVSLAYPVALLCVAAAVASVAGYTEVDRSSLNKSFLMALQMFAATWIGTIITEEGFFRGWLWGSLSRSGLGARAILIWTSLVFALWHIPVAMIEENFRLPMETIPVYTANAFLLGAAWGIIRMTSGSIVVAGFCHGVWNGIVYVFFGYGTKSGALGITQYKMFDPERGLLGLALNVIAVLLLWRWATRRGRG